MSEINLKRAPFSNDTGSGTAAGGASTGEQLEKTADIAPRDWDCLFSAVIDRLQITVTDKFAGEHDARAGDALVAVVTSVRECVDALAQLRASLIYELNSRDQLAAELEHARMQLAEVRAHNDPAGTQEREMRARRLALHGCLAELPNRGALASD
jgi:hypothetical protein